MGISSSDGRMLSPASTFEQTSYRKANSDVPCFCVSFALAWSSNIQVVEIECSKVAEILPHLQQCFPAAYEAMIINAIVEYRPPTRDSVHIIERRAVASDDGSVNGITQNPGAPLSPNYPANVTAESPRHLFEQGDSGETSRCPPSVG
jgi:hypothetical protein